MDIQKKLGIKVPTAIASKIKFQYHLRWTCRAVVIAASASSVWANWLHSDKNPAAITINIFPPLIVLVGFELTSRIPAWEGPRWHPRRWIRPLAMTGITFIGAWLSYWHQKAAFLQYSHDKQTAMLLPLAIDGLMIISSVAVLDITDKIERLTYFAEAGGITTSKPKEKETLPTKPKDKAPSKKELIVDYLKRYPEMPVPDVAKATSATMNYVYAIKDELRKVEQPADMTPVMA
jgi:hypothetical protein